MKPFFCLFLWLFSLNTLAQDFKEMIEKNQQKLDACNSRGYFDKDYIRCYNESAKNLDSVLNVVYKKTMTLLKKNDQANFRDTQRKWLDFYNHEKRFNAVFDSRLRYNEGGYALGTLADLQKTATNHAMLKNRVETLVDYHLILTTGL